MSREEVAEMIQEFFGWDHESVKEIVSEMGADAFSDEALSAIATRQWDRERWEPVKLPSWDELDGS